MPKKLLAICFEFAPELTPLSIKSTKLLSHLSEDWQIRVITSNSKATEATGIPSIYVKFNPPHSFSQTLHKLRLDKFIEWFPWPDDRLFWVIPALRAALKCIREWKPDAVVVFVMPYSAGILGYWLKKLTKLPLVINFDDSLSCTDMHPAAPSPLHARLATWLEDLYVKIADRVVYVSQYNMELVQKREFVDDQAKFRLVRCGADPLPPLRPEDRIEPASQISIVYTGGMTCWRHYLPKTKRGSLAKHLYALWMNIGRCIFVRLDPRGSGPVVISRAIRALELEEPSLLGRLKVQIFGNQYPLDIVNQVLASQEISDLVEVNGPIGHAEVVAKTRSADILFIALPARRDGSRGGRISAKTYEYLMTDRPILAAVPRGENWDYLRDAPGVWLTEPMDELGMKHALKEVIGLISADRGLAFDRTALHQQISYAQKAIEFSAVIDEAIEACAR